MYRDFLATPVWCKVWRIIHGRTGGGGEGAKLATDERDAGSDRWTDFKTEIECRRLDFFYICHRMAPLQKLYFVTLT